MYLFSLVLFALTVFNLGAFAQPSNQDERKPLTLQQKKALQAKEAELKEILEKNPRVAEAHLNLGNVYWAQGRDGKPIRHYLAAIKLNPNYAEAYYNLANIFFIQGEHEQAVKAYQKAIEIKPDFVPALNGLANAFVDEKKYTEAIHNYKRAEEIDPTNEDTLYNLCTTLIYAARYDEAVNSCQQAAEKTNDARAYNNLGNAFFRKKRYEDASVAYNKAIQLNSELSEAHFNLAAISLLHRKNRQEALNRQKILQVLDPQKSSKLSALIKSAPGN
jgi:tetratricopeptide (TPR) repeat protein